MTIVVGWLKSAHPTMSIIGRDDFPWDLSNNQKYKKVCFFLKQAFSCFVVSYYIGML